MCGGHELLLTDSFKVYRMVNDGIIRLIDLFFEMGKMNAMKALDVYKRAHPRATTWSACTAWRTIAYVSRDKVSAD